MKKYLKLFRVSHYLKNILIFIPLFFSKSLFYMNDILSLLYYIVPFCLVSSAVYVINDINDIDKDRKHPQKKKRPLASGAISVKSAKISVAVLLLVSVAMLAASFLIHNFSLSAILLLLAYLVINLMYSKGLKNVPILDITILAAGYLIRLFYGAVVIGVEVSSLLYLTVLMGAFYLGMGKRRNEMKNSDGKESRKVLKLYNYDFLDKNMHMCLSLTIVFYALWAIQTDYRGIIWTVPLIIIILMKYSLDIEGEGSEGNPMEVVLKDKILISLCAIYVLIMFVVIYLL